MQGHDSLIRNSKPKNNMKTVAKMTLASNLKIHTRFLRLGHTQMTNSKMLKSSPLTLGISSAPISNHLANHSKKYDTVKSKFAVVVAVGVGVGVVVGVAVNLIRMVMEYETVERRYFKIGEVAKILDLDVTTVRWWLNAFEIDRTIYRARGHGSTYRQFVKGDIDKLREVKRLMRDELLTIPGARKKMNLLFSL